MNELVHAISLILGIIFSCIAVGGILVRINSHYQTQATIDSIALTNSQLQVWKINKRRLAALFLGAILYGAVLSITNASSTTVAPNWFWVYSLPVVALLYFGAVFGPWIGLFVGVIGEILFALIGARIYNSSFFFPTSGVIGDAIIGFIAGLSFIYTRGRFGNIRSLVIVDIIGTIGIVLGDLFFSILSQNQFQQSFGQTFSLIILPDIVCGLVLLPLLLTLYNKSIAYES